MASPMPRDGWKTIIIIVVFIGVESFFFLFWCCKKNLQSQSCNYFFPENTPTMLRPGRRRQLSASNCHKIELNCVFLFFHVVYKRFVAGDDLCGRPRNNGWCCCCCWPTVKTVTCDLHSLYSCIAGWFKWYTGNDRELNDLSTSGYLFWKLAETLKMFWN